jgi:hypothetical protein
MKYWTVMIFKYKGRLLLFFTLLFAIAIPAIVNSQISINSPYTRYGVGSLVENGLDPRTTAMGYLHYGLQRNDLINPANPASYASFDTVSFLFDAGLFGVITKLRTGQVQDQGSFITLSHLLFGFPVTKWWKASFGVMPYSLVGYDIYNIQDFQETTPVVYNYNGFGGFSQLYWGNGFSVGKHISVGFNLKYIFGSITRKRGVGFPDSLEVKNTYVAANVRPRDIFGDVGVQYRANLPKEHYMVVGVDFTPQTMINSKATYLATTYFGLINSTQFYYDTIEFIPNKLGTWTMPWKIGAGVTAGKAGQWLAGADFEWQNWQNYTYYGMSDSLLNSWKISAGGEFVPDPRSTDSYFQRVAYRLGAHIGKTPIYLKDHHINEVGITFGMGFPIKKSRSTINFSASLGKEGTINDGLIQENFLRFTLGVNVYERWFLKSKYY